MKNARPYLKHLLFFISGFLCGLVIMWHIGWGVMYSLMGADAQAKYSAMNASMDAYSLAQYLSAIRLDNTKDATNRLEKSLDQKIIEAHSWIGEGKNAKYSDAIRGQLQMVKLYRKIVPPQAKYKNDIEKILATVPDLPRKPSSDVPIGKLYNNRK